MEGLLYEFAHSSDQDAVRRLLAAREDEVTVTKGVVQIAIGKHSGHGNHTAAAIDRRSSRRRSRLLQESMGEGRGSYRWCSQA